MNLLYYKQFRCSSCNPHKTSRVLTWITHLHDVGASRWYFVFLVNEVFPFPHNLLEFYTNTNRRYWCRALWWVLMDMIWFSSQSDPNMLLCSLLTWLEANRRSEMEQFAAFTQPKDSSTVNLAQLQKRLKKHEGKVPNLQWFHLGLFDFMVMQKRSSSIRNCISIFEFWASPGWQ